ncbi:unnamed protein product [Lactuca saligna]|uniref:MULE transposase domain-containing protein n=1 Tax=Lactuca saligna TaxID=75948 RepID=A0AA36E5K9_LACSI|nr:unnamed protein product [Lactuca saligna]
MVIFISIKVHFQGVFINKLFCYSDGVHHVFDNIDFVEGLTLISNELQYQEFIDIAYRCGVQVPVYMDHFGTTVHLTKANENENEVNCFVKSNMSIEREESIDLIDFMSPQQSNMEGVTYEGVSQANGNEDATEGDPNCDEDENIPDVKGKQMFNEDILEEAVSNSRDDNNHIFPIAWAAVCVENKDNWKWFLENLQEDLHLEGGFGKTLMSDQHKG